MHIKIDTDNLSEQDIAILALLIGQPSADEDKPKRRKRTAAKKPEPDTTTDDDTAATAKPEPDDDDTPADEDLVGGSGPTLADAIEAATAAVSNGGAPKVKQALASVDTKRVSELAEENIAPFLAALESAMAE